MPARNICKVCRLKTLKRFEGVFNMIRAITAIILGFVVVAAVWWLPIWSFDLIVLATALLGLIEFARMFFDDPMEQGVTVIAGGIVALTMIFCPIRAESALLLLPLVFFVVALFFMWRTQILLGVAERLGLSMLGVLYLGFAFCFWSWIRHLPSGQSLVLLVLAPACLCDTFAFLFGRMFGRHKFASQISPNKTMEGFLGALVGSFVGVFLIRWLVLPKVSWAQAIVLVFVIWIVSPFGDLIESMFKRSVGVKDSGTLIPGHGGVLDRLDALIFTAPAAYVFTKYVLPPLY